MVKSLVVAMLWKHSSFIFYLSLCFFFLYLLIYCSGPFGGITNKEWNAKITDLPSINIKHSLPNSFISSLQRGKGYIKLLKNDTVVRWEKNNLNSSLSFMYKCCIFLLGRRRIYISYMKMWVRYMHVYNDKKDSDYIVNWFSFKLSVSNASLQY